MAAVHIHTTSAAMATPSLLVLALSGLNLPAPAYQTGGS
jgi:hypothetical protein